MKYKTLVKVRFLFFTLTTLAFAWQTSMSGVEWNTMDWVAQSCLFAGIVGAWGTTMGAFFDKTVSRMEQETLELTQERSGTRPRPSTQPESGETKV